MLPEYRTCACPTNCGLWMCPNATYSYCACKPSPWMTMSSVSWMRNNDGPMCEPCMVTCAANTVGIVASNFGWVRISTWAWLKALVKNWFFSLGVV